MPDALTVAPLLEVEGLVVTRGRFRLEVPRWEVRAGQVVGVVGPNRAGKTTLLETVAGLRPSTRGRVRVFGLDPWDEASVVRSALGFMTDDMPVFTMRVSALLELVSGYYPSWDPDLARTLAQRLGLDVGQRSDRLSKGDGTRLRLLLATAFRPRVLVLDEPATGLDLSGRRALLQTVLEVAADPQRCVLVSSHQLGDVERLATHLLVLHDGRVVRAGEAAALLGEGRTLEDALVAWGAA